MNSPIQSYLDALHARCMGIRDGAVADYIPELGLANPEWLGICVATSDGAVYEAGDTRQPFTIQSMSKPFTYGLALQDRGDDAVAAKIGVEPSGDAFNSISLEPETGRPRNPMINAGAITATSLVEGIDAQDRFGRILRTFSRYAGRPLTIDEAVFASERRTGHRNRAIGHMLRTFAILEDEPDTALDLYFRQCSVAVDCRDVAIMGATLANGGRNPLTGERAVSEHHVPRVLSVMTTCGMYDGSGRWVDEVGLPAKSGVAGGIFAVLPGQLCVSVFSPRLDPQGNSVRGVAAARALAHDLHLHSLRVARSARSTIRVSYDLGAMPSRRRRTPRQTELLRTLGPHVVVHELQGDLLFSGAERVVRAIVGAADELEIAVLDLRAVDRIAAPAAQLLNELRATLRSRRSELVLVVGGANGNGNGNGNGVDPRLTDMPTFSDPEAAREWCENRLLEAARMLGDELAPIEFADHALCEGLDLGEIELLASLMTTRSWRAGERIFSAGDDASEIYFLLDGTVEVSRSMRDGSRRRFVSLTPGRVFGELAVVGRATRSADVTAGLAATAMVLDIEAFMQLDEDAPALQSQLLRNMLAGAYDMVSRMTREVAALAG